MSYSDWVQPIWLAFAATAALVVFALTAKGNR